MASSYNTRSTRQQRGHFSITLTNNPHMLLQGAEQVVRDGSTTSKAHQGAATSETQSQPVPLVSRSPVRLLRYMPQTMVSKQQALVTISPQAHPLVITEYQPYERAIEKDLQVQIQPILQNYLNKTKRTSPINLFLDMTSIIQY